MYILAVLMENLTKQQIILVTLLVSFVTSIATGVVTVSLMDQAPQGVTQTINRVVERTIERVVPAEIPAQKATIKETIVVRADDQAVAAVAKTSPSVIRISFQKPEDTEATFGGLGLILSKNGYILADRATYIPDARYSGVIEKKSYPLRFVGINGDSNTVVFLVELPASDKQTQFVPATLGNSDTLKLGQSVIGLGGSMRPTVSLGIVAGITENGQATSTAAITTDITSLDTVSGSILLNLSGEVVAIKTILSGENTKGVFLPINSVQQYLIGIR